METQENNGVVTGEQAEKELTLAEQMEKKSHGEIGKLAGGFLDRIGYTAVLEALETDEAGEYAGVPVTELMAGYIDAAATLEETGGDTGETTPTVMVEISEEELAAIREAALRCTALEAELSILNGYGVGMEHKKWAEMSDSEVARIAKNPGMLRGRALGNGVDFPMYAGAAQNEAAKRLEKLAMERIVAESHDRELDRYLREHQNDIPAPKKPFRPE